MADAAGRRIQELIVPVHMTVDRTTALSAAHGVNDVHWMRTLRIATGQPADPFGKQLDGEKTTNGSSPVFFVLFPEP